MQINVKERRGFTLVEIIVSLLILAVGVAGVMSTFVASERFTSRSMRRLQAANYARETFERLRKDVDAGVWAVPGGADTLDASPGTWKPCGINLGDFANPPFDAICEYEVQSVLNDARRVTLNITWTEP